MLTLTKNSILICATIINTALYSQISIQQDTKDKDPTHEITATIDSENSELQLENLKGFFLENEMELIIKKITLNEQNKITGIYIVLKKGVDSTEFSSNSNLPIPKLTLGFRNNNVFISTPTLATHSFPNKNPASISWSSMTMDSLLKKHHFAFRLGSENEAKDFFDISELKEMINNFMSKDNDTLFRSFQQLKPPSLSNTQQFKFTDNPSIHKLIIINGKESDFNTLNTYAIANQLAAVDILQPETAITIYGNKAKDGAIIATTKD